MNTCLAPIKKNSPLRQFRSGVEPHTSPGVYLAAAKSTSMAVSPFLGLAPGPGLTRTVLATPLGNLRAKWHRQFIIIRKYKTSQINSLLSSF